MGGPRRSVLRAEARDGGPASGTPTDPPSTPAPAGPRPTAVMRLVAGARDHPLLVVGSVAVAVALGHALWIWSHRHVGAIDPDEAGYAATALRYHRSLDLLRPWGLPLEVARTGTGPLVPLVSVPLLVVGPDDPRTALLAQPILMVATAVLVAAVARRLAGPAAAVAAGLTVVGLPTVVSATLSYWLGLGAAAALAGAVLALLHSDRLTNRWTWVFGLGVALMLLARTMTLGYLPGLAAAGLVVAWGRRDSLVGLAKAAAVTVAVAGPWYLAARGAVFDYLFSYGYGERAGLFGEDTLAGRLDARATRVEEGLGGGVRWGALVLGAGVVIGLIARRRPAVDRRGLAAVGSVVVLGFAALLTTANSGVWFELPVVVLLVALVWALGAWAPRPFRWAALVPVVVAAALQLASAWWIIPPDRDGVPFVPAQGRVAHYEWGFDQYDERLGADRRDELVGAAADWWDLSSDVERALHRLDAETDGALMVTFSGSFQLFNSNTVALAAEMEGWTPRIWIPDTVVTPDERAAHLTPAGRDGSGDLITEDGRPVERVLVLARHDLRLFTPDERVEALTREAADRGWEPVQRFPVPVGGEVVLLRHPDAP